MTASIGTFARRSLYAALLALLPLVSQPAAAQVVVIVNGLPITEIDIEQRIKLERLTQRQLSREQALNILIEDKLKISAGKRFGMELSDAEVDQNFAEIAQRSGQTAEQFTQTLGRAGVSATALKNRVKADVTWSQLIRGRYQQSLQVSEGELANAMQSKPGEETGYIYTLRPVIVIVPRDSNPAAIEQKKREAEALRGRFQDCNQGVAMMRGLRDVAVRDPVRRSSAEVSPQLREILSKLEVGRLTVPEPTQQGLQMFALCDKRETKTETAEKRELKDRLFSERFDREAKKYLDEVRRTSIIERR